jgi:hypothetical protein
MNISNKSFSAHNYDYNFRKMKKKKYLDIVKSAIFASLYCVVLWNYAISMLGVASDNKQKLFLTFRKDKNCTLFGHVSIQPNL